MWSEGKNQNWEAEVEGLYKVGWEWSANDMDIMKEERDVSFTVTAYLSRN